MQGFMKMLSAMGLDPEKLKLQAESFFKSVEERFHRAEEHAAELEVRLQEVERLLGMPAIVSDVEQKSLSFQSLKMDDAP